MTTKASQTTSLTVAYSTFIQPQIKENIKATHHWPLCGEFTGTGEFPAQRASYAENVSIWWRHRAKSYIMPRQASVNLRHPVLVSYYQVYEVKLINNLN